MSTVYLDNGHNGKLRIIDICSPISGEQLMGKLTNIIGDNSCNYFLKNNGRLVENNDIIYNGDVLLEPKLCGGKGGFGSMLRAIGAQIEKTTNREACRDLSGRRLRDINEEKRLKAWIEKQGERDEEAKERKKRKLAKLCAEPKHVFKDKTYEKQRANMNERVEDAVEAGFAAAAAAASTSVKRVADQDVKTNLKKKKKTILDDDIDSDDLESSSDESSNEKEIGKAQSCSENNSNKSDNDNSSDSTSNDPSANSNEEKSNSANNSPKSKQHIDEASR